MRNIKIRLRFNKLELKFLVARITRWRFPPRGKVWRSRRWADGMWRRPVWMGPR